MALLLNITIVLVSFGGMEGVAWLAHKYLMHGLLWGLHRDHHKKDQYGFFEHNDFFFLIFATPGISCLALGIYTPAGWLLYIGLGITLYGLCYFLVHDVFIHQRIKSFRNSDNWYLRAIRRAHKVHHKHLGKEDGECFGMLWVPMKYFRESKSARR
ncbi:MAG TPA: sterol desaturase family protein [Mucilaginibacter sp.]|nr:sterol desaturase family protein [Mucilaginibacter sp.]